MPLLNKNKNTINNVYNSKYLKIKSNEERKKNKKEIINF